MGPLPYPVRLGRIGVIEFKIADSNTTQLRIGALRKMRDCECHEGGGCVAWIKLYYDYYDILMRRGIDWKQLRTVARILLQI